MFDIFVPLNLDRWHGAHGAQIDNAVSQYIVLWSKLPAERIFWIQNMSDKIVKEA